MGQFKRARSVEHKQIRARQILQAARALEERHGFTALAVADVARTARVAKGTVFLYFATKEGLGLALLRELQDEWFSALDASLAERAGLEARTLASLVAQSLSARPALVRMIAQQGALERNCEAPSVRSYRRWLLMRMRSAAGLLEARLPYLTRGDGLRLLLFIQVLMVGLQPLAEPCASAREALTLPELAPLRLDFRGSLESALRVHMEGLRTLRGGVE